MNMPGAEASAAADQPVLVEQRGPILWLTINREAVRNALNDQVLATLAEAIRGAANNSELRAIVITGAGNRVFSAGGDLKAGGSTFEFDFSQPSTTFADMLRAANQTNLPLVARVNGHCLAGGMGLLSACDMAIATEGALFGLPEVKIGMFPMQVAVALRRILPPRVFAEMCFAGESISARDAQQFGLLNYVVPAAELDAKLDRLLERIAANSPTAIRRGKYALRATQDMSYDQSLAYMETQLSTLSLTQDAREGIASFNEKRTPNWSGR